MRDGGIDDRNLHQILLGILDTLRDSGSDFIRLSKTITDDAVLIAHDHDGRETEMTSTLGDLGNALDSDEAVLELQVRGLHSFYICICHSLS